MKQTQHHVKTLPKYFSYSYMNSKPFEIRKNDRDYKNGDLLYLHEWEDGEYTGKILSRMINFVFSDLPGLDPEYVILAVQPM